MPCGGRKLCRPCSGGVSVLVDQAVAVRWFHDLKVMLGWRRRCQKNSTITRRIHRLTRFGAAHWDTTDHTRLTVWSHLDAVPLWGFCSLCRLSAICHQNSGEINGNSGPRRRIWRSFRAVSPMRSEPLCPVSFCTRWPPSKSRTWMFLRSLSPEYWLRSKR